MAIIVFKYLLLSDYLAQSSNSRVNCSSCSAALLKKTHPVCQWLSQLCSVFNELD